MKVKALALLVGSTFLAASCCTTKTYSVNAKSGTQTGGTAKFTQKGNEVVMNLNVTNLTPGIHAVHIHEKGDCSAADGTSTGGHWNPAKDDHGKWGAEHFHMGDIGNLVADQSGNATLTFKTDKWCLGCTDESKNIIGKGLIVHAAADDFHTQPTGNAGGRVGCVEIK
ncbi:superoxide dismutase family protein [Chryseobacterium defluvii]|uniref:Cu-Zn family superoxide dismutase n=1 Tax=Chryseobacterium defluvii TaxID=160396 RepID=A0A495SBN9_9FLAO|nr:superoxide dismutase family protein [Chryseobacterium defluvii]RKS96558.1 Cu-Zn family superoxide dismutase [Chryseobacterium defluvii]